ncbi:MAG: toxin-antitoxin system YwqK family antitoxin [Bacteroidota bacterium]
MRSIKSIFLLAVLTGAGLVMASRILPEPKASFVSTTPVARVQFEELERVKTTGVLFWAGTPFTGFAIQTHSKGQLAEQTYYYDGKRDGLSVKWYPNGVKSFEAGYMQNRRHGVTKNWWPDGTLRAESHYINGVAHGVQRQWYQSGALFKQLNISHGKEDGLQQAWRENGKLYANYAAVDGKIYGLKRANLCFDLDGETLQTSNQVQQ